MGIFMSNQMADIFEQIPSGKKPLIKMIKVTS